MPKQERKVDFIKYSSLHSSLVSKGYYWNVSTYFSKNELRDTHLLDK